MTKVASAWREPPSRRSFRVVLRGRLLLCVLCSSWVAACGKGSEGWVLQERAGAGGITGLTQDAGSAGEGGAGGEGGSPLSQAGKSGSGGSPSNDLRCPTRFASACSPAVTVDNRDQTASGMLFTEAIVDPSTTLSCITRDVCDILYRKASEIRVTTKITILIEDFAGLSQTYHSNGEATIRVSSRHLQKVANANADVGEEIRNLFYYHATNTYQFDANDGFANAWLVEGVADYVRRVAGYLPDSQRQAGGAYDDGGSTTGFFLVWLDQKYPDFVYELNASLDPSRGVKWTTQAFLDITGQSVDDLWAAYQASF